MKTISIIIPVLNEQDAIPIFYKKVRTYEPLKNYKVELVFVDDGSTDNTPKILSDIAHKDTLVKVVSFIRNFGKESAVFAGLENATGDAVIPMDVDLQDPIEVVPQMINKWHGICRGGVKTVLAKRINRNESFFKRITAKYFYKIFNIFSNEKIEHNVGDFRLLDREIVDNILQLPERNLFMKGVLSWVGGSYDIVEYERPKRIVGNTNFNFYKLLKLAIEGITSFSTKPLRIASFLGFTVSLFSFLFAVYHIVKKLFFGNNVEGYPSLIVVILFLGGVQLITIGILGEYIGKIYTEVKQRPRYLIKKGNKNEK